MATINAYQNPLPQKPASTSQQGQGSNDTLVDARDLKPLPSERATITPPQPALPPTQEDIDRARVAQAELVRINEAQKVENVKNVLNARKTLDSLPTPPSTPPFSAPTLPPLPTAHQSASEVPIVPSASQRLPLSPSEIAETEEPIEEPSSDPPKNTLAQETNRAVDQSSPVQQQELAKGGIDRMIDFIKGIPNVKFNTSPAPATNAITNSPPETVKNDEQPSLSADPDEIEEGILQKSGE